MANDQAVLWRGKVDAVVASKQAYWPILDGAEQAQAEKFKTALLRQRYIEAHGCLRRILSQTLGEPPAQIRMAKTAYGKPYLADHPGLAFNLSHSADAWMVALAWQCQLGVDIEVIKPRLNVAGLVDRCFAEEEARYWLQLPEAEKTQAFYYFWTRKEAFVKATGFGVALGLNHCVINPQQPTELLRVPKNCGQANEWAVWDIEVGEGRCGALVADKRFSVIKVMDFAGPT